MDVIKEKSTTKLISMAVGKYDRVEYADEAVVLRNFDIKEVDRGGRIRIYFDNNDEQVMTGRRFDVIGERLILRMNTAYRVVTNIVIGEDFPARKFEVELTQDAKDVVGLLSYTAKRGEPVSFTMQVFHPMELEKMVSLAVLHISDYVNSEAGGVSKKRVSAEIVVPKTPKRKVPNSSRTKKSVETASKTSGGKSIPHKEKGDASNVSKKPTETT